MERIVITGGPGSGRFEMIKMLLKYKIYTDTRLFLATNPAYWELTNSVNPVFSWQDVFKWQAYTEPKEDLPGIDGIVHSCGFPGIKYFATEDEFAAMCEQYNIGEMKERYTAVLFLDTVAKTYPASYPYISDEKTVDLYDAVVLNDRLLDTWVKVVGEDRVYTIPATESFFDKVVTTLSTLEGVIHKDDSFMRYKMYEFMNYVKAKEN